MPPQQSIWRFERLGKSFRSQTSAASSCDRRPHTSAMMIPNRKLSVGPLLNMGAERCSQSPAAGFPGTRSVVTKCSPKRSELPGRITDGLLTTQAIASFVALGRSPPPTHGGAFWLTDRPPRPPGSSNLPPLGNLGAAQFALGPAELVLHGPPPHRVPRLPAHSAQRPFHASQGVLRAFPLRSRISHTAGMPGLLLGYTHWDGPHPHFSRIQRVSG